jgi:23S rRNA (cytosine1962-C5)-methyltransferase
MDRARVWPDFRDAWIVHEDADIVLVDKPAGVSSQAADAERPDDLVTRLKRFLRARGSSDYLGVHQRLDRDTSGLLVFARRREANASLAAQFEGRAVSKTYVACVTGWRERREKVTLRDWLAPGSDGRVQVASRRGGAAKEAVTQVRVLSRRGERAMVELSLDTGRTHQARVQLAHAGAPIAGDALYGGSPALRLMLHARELSFEHPATRKRVRFEAPVPADLRAWWAKGDAGVAVYDDEGALTLALDRAVERRWGLGRGGYATTAFRLVNEEGDGLTRLAVDVYGDWLVAQFYGDDGPWADSKRRELVLDRLHAIGFDGVYLKMRPKQANVIVDPHRADLAPSAPVRGRAAPDELEVTEEGLLLLARLGDGLSTGLFLDQRANRKRVREMADGLKVANLFSYTCAFSVAAAQGGAASTVSVDASVNALARGRANFERAGLLEKGVHTLVADDAFRWMARAARRGDTFDLIIVDPPSYSTTRQGRFVAQDDYSALAAAALRLLAPGGRLLACTNHRGISTHRFRRMLFDACRSAKREAAQVKDLQAQSDFPVPAGGEAHMKSAIVTLTA